MFFYKVNRLLSGRTGGLFLSSFFPTLNLRIHMRGNYCFCKNRCPSIKDRSFAFAISMEIGRFAISTDFALARLPSDDIIVFTNLARSVQV